jgi:hypothetical protein
LIKGKTMAYMGCFTREQRTAIEARAKEIMKNLRVRVPCNCYHQQDTGNPGHAPDCARMNTEDAAWDYAVDKAADELGF